MLRIAVFASGGGTNLQALLDHFNGRSSALARVALVVSDRGDAGALGRAEQAGVATRVIGVRGRESADVAADTLAALEEHAIDIVALAGYLKLVPESVVRRFRGRIVNIHPALLPAFGGPGMYGIRVHRAVLEAGCWLSGVTVHQVDERYDEGRPIAQWPVPVLRGDAPESLAARVLRVEHRLYPLALEALCAEIERGITATGGGTRFPDPAAFEAIDDTAPSDAALRRMLGLDREAP
ncbi:MAG: phosphoribosylglycinamide formyltransferase [Gemmatimonadota bacterium]|jgi:formyltetrahydrofolate-dependent phosphoribosylglycinamide formyltransferase